MPVHLLVSGRTIASLDALFAPLRLPSAGLHGLERRNQGEVLRTEVDASALERVREAARGIVARYPGAVCEDKGVALALHWRAEPLAAASGQGGNEVIGKPRQLAIRDALRRLWADQRWGLRRCVELPEAHSTMPPSMPITWPVETTMLTLEPASTVV